MDNAIGGKLKLKKPLDGGIKKKKKRKSGGDDASSSRKEEAGEVPLSAEDGGPLDTRTAYEKKWDEQQKAVEKRQAKATAVKSHRDRLNEFNEKLAALSEHHDVPRVSGGC